MNTILIREAELLTTGAEIHKTRGLVAWYKGMCQSKDCPQVRNAIQLAEDNLVKHVKMLRSKCRRL